MLKTFVVYGHLIVTCIALGTIISTDWQLFKRRHKPLRKSDIDNMHNVQKTITASLLALWVTGLSLVAIGYDTAGLDYLLNQKLWVKVIVVSLLTINGALLHRFAFKNISTSVVLTQLPAAARNTSALLTAISSSSWLFAAFLGIARPWNYTISVYEILTWYAALLCGAVMVAFISQQPQGYFSTAENH